MTTLKESSSMILYNYRAIDSRKVGGFRKDDNLLQQASMQGFLYKNIDQISSEKPNETPLV